MRVHALILGLLLGLAVPFSISAAEADGHEQDELRLQVERGEIRPLSDVLAAVRGKLPGEVVKVEVERHGGVWVYELRVLDLEGRVFEIYIDARSATVQRVEEK